MYMYVHAKLADGSKSIHSCLSEIIKGDEKMKKSARIIVVFIMILSLNAWSAFAGGAEDSAAAGNGALKVALLVPGPINDQGWSESAYIGLKEIEKELGAEITVSESVPASDYEEIFRSYATAGYDLVIGHGFQFGDAAMKVALDFQDTSFLVTSTDISQEPNVASFRMNDVQSGFVQGYIAAQITKTKKLGAIGGMEIPPISNQQIGFESGAKYADPDIEVIKAFIGNFEDVAKGKELATAMIQNNVDVIAPNANKAGLGPIEAAAGTDTKIIGYVGDLALTYPDEVVTSVLEDMAYGFVLLAKYVQEGTYKAEAYVLGFEDGIFEVAPFRKHEGSFSKEALDNIDKLVEELKAETFDYTKYIVD